MTGVPLDRYFHDPKTMFDTQLEVLERLEKCGSFQPDPGPVAECSGLGGHVSLLGGLHPVELQSMSAQQTYDVCMEKLRSFGGNNKFVLGVGGSVNQIPVENLMAMFHAADDYKL